MQKKIHLFNCDHLYELRVIEDLLNSSRPMLHDKLGFDFTVEHHYFSLNEIDELSEKVIPSLKSGGGQGGGSPGEQGAGGVRETGEERAGSGISMMAGSGREIPKGKLSLIVTAHHPVKETNSTTFLDFHLTFSEALNQNFNARKSQKT